MELLNNIINENAITAFSVTVIKSVWIGAIISGLTAILLAFIRKSARTRYTIAATGLAIIFISSATIFFRYVDSTRHFYGDEAMIPAVTFFQPSDGDLGNDEISSRFNIPGIIPELIRGTERIFIYHSEFIVLIWIIGVIILSVKFTGAYFYIRRLRSRITTDIPDIWAARIEKIAEKISLRTKFRTVKSAIAKIPMVTGWLKPVVILPVSVLTGMPAEQVEAIIAHELAHIKRNDYLVNMFQSLIEIFMFYNPSVWWISSVMRRERENCCDDIALAAGTEPVVYTKALVSIQEISFSPRVPAVAIKINNNLINRIKRITAMRNRNNILKDKFVAMLSIVLLVSSLVALTGFKTKTNSFTQVSMEKKSALSYSISGNSLVESANHVILPQDTVRKKEASTIRTKWTDPVDNLEKDVSMSIENSQVIELIIDGEVIPHEDYHFYNDLIENTIQDYEQAMKELEALDTEKIEKEIEEAKLELEQLDMEEIERELAEAMLEIEQIDMEEIERAFEEAKLEIEQIDMEEIEKEIKEALKGLEAIDMKEIQKEIKKARKNK